VCSCVHNKNHSDYRRRVVLRSTCQALFCERWQKFRVVGCEFVTVRVRWRRSVVKYGVRVSQVKPSNYCRLHLTSHWFSNTQQYRFLTACRHLEKLVLPPVLTLAFHSWWCETYRVIQQFWMKTCGFWGVKTYCDPPTYFHGSRPLNPPGSRPLSTWNLWLIMRVQ